MAGKTVPLSATDAEEAKYRPHIEAMTTEIACILKGMKRKQARIEKLRTRTRSRLDGLKVLMR